jgi:peptidoglycan/LPS O-acetylase OafA/YrhL
VDSWTLIRYLHVIALAFFVGGQLMLVAAIVPAMRRHPARDEVMRAVAKRFGIGSLVALAVLLATGAAMAAHFALWADSVLQAKLALLVLIGVLTGLHVVTPYTRAISLAVFVTSLVIVWLGVVLTH